MKKKLLNSNIHLALLPIFYILHANNEFQGLIPFRSSALYAGSYLLLALILFQIGKWILGSAAKAGLWAFLLLLPFLFFGPLHDLLKTILRSRLSSYSIVLPALLAYFIILTIVIRKKRNEPFKTIPLLNLTTIVLAIIELFSFGYFHLEGRKNISKLQGSITLEEKSLSQGNDTIPDIFFIVFDEFASTLALKKYLNYDNSRLDSMLAQNGFYIVSNSKSNYNITNLSLASTLNMQYLPGDLEGATYDAKMLLRGSKEIRQSRLPELLGNNGYELKNYGLFNLPGKKVMISEFFDGYPEKPLYLHTLYGRMKRDLYWNIAVRMNPDVEKENIQAAVKRNQENFEATLNELRTPTSRPRFVYAHFMMPHMPFYFDRDGKPIANPVYIPDPKKFDSLYLDQLIYTNTWIQEIINAAARQQGRPLVLVIEGDHGYREVSNSPDRAKQFMNLNTIYFNDGDYSQLYDSITPVNTFRLILNKYFNRDLPILKDSSILVNPSSQNF